MGPRLRLQEQRTIPDISPFTALCYSGDPIYQLTIARNHLRRTIPASVQPLVRAARATEPKIRVAYLSGDFRRHPVASLIVELLEQHDRERFDVVTVSFGPDDRSELRARVMAASDEFHDVRLVSDRDVAKLVQDRKIDIAVDLMGHTEHSRTSIFAFRRAPIQVNYLGYPGTMGADFIDYIIGDQYVTPFAHARFYSEKIVQLPYCFLPNDSKKAISPRVFCRHECGLPEHGFVFCCFNNSYKITEPVFNIWMQLLRDIEGAVIWLSQLPDNAIVNLRREAQARGVNPARLVIAPRLERLDEHLARQVMADLFLDTLPYNAHTTACEALWAGLPILTCVGTTFAGRVGASVLHAMGLSELVTENLEEYGALARRLASDSALLLALRQRLQSARKTSPLFDTGRYCGYLEEAYRAMWNIWRHGENPRCFRVAAALGPATPEPMQ